MWFNIMKTPGLKVGGRFFVLSDSLFNHLAKGVKLYQFDFLKHLVILGLIKIKINLTRIFAGSCDNRTWISFVTKVKDFISRYPTHPASRFIKKIKGPGIWIIASKIHRLSIIAWHMLQSKTDTLSNGIPFPAVSLSGLLTQSALTAFQGLSRKDNAAR